METTRFAKSLGRATGLRSLLLWLGLAVTVLFTYLAVRNVDFGEVSSALRASNYWWVFPSLAVLALAILIRAVRWRVLFLPERRPALSSVTSALLVGYLFNNLLPARAGEAARVVALHQRGGTSRAETVGTVVVERAYDVLSLLVLLFVALPWLPGVSWLGEVTVFAAVFGTAAATGVIVLVLFGDRAVRFLMRPLGRMPFLSGERVEHAAGNLTQGLAAVRKPSLALAAFCWTTLSWLVMAVSFWLLMLAFDLGLSPFAGLLVVIAIGLSMILPSAPAAIGVFEAATVLAVTAYGIDRSVALSYALVLHALNFVPYLVVGVLVLHLHLVRVRRGAAAPLEAEAEA